MEIPLEWYQFKLLLATTGGIDLDTLHVVAGVLVQLGVALIFRIPVTRWTPWLAALAFELVNEWSDLQLEAWPDRGMQYGAAVKDIWLTMFVPTLLLVTSRLMPGLYEKHRD